LTTLIEAGVESSAAPAVATASSRKNRWLPILIVLFLISYSLMVMLIVEQGQTIESQRVLIRELFRDNTQLSAVKVKGQEDGAQSAPSDAAAVQVPSSQVSAAATSSNQTSASQAPSNQSSPAQVPSTQIQPTQTPSSQIPSSQAKSSAPVASGQHRSQTAAPKTKSDFQMPSRPASDLEDSARSLKTI
jgi:hypothetical protein